MGSDLRVGTVLGGRYRVTGLLGEGGMGAVYRGERVKLGRPVAIKFLHSPYVDAKEFVSRFDREARAMSMLNHPCCVSVIDFGVEEEPYIVMDFVVGITLRDALDHQALTPQRSVQVIRQVLTGLAHAHGHGIIHRDIKPGNIMLGEATGIGDHVRIFDFGLAKLQDPSAHGDPSVAHLVGTPAYMAPEQTRGDRIDGRVDVYSTGVVLFEALSGKKPFDADDIPQLLRMQRDLFPPRVRSLSPEISEELDAVVDRALRKLPEERFQSATEFLEALDQTPEAAAAGGLRPANRPSVEDQALARTQTVAAERVIEARKGPAAPLGSPSRSGDSTMVGRGTMQVALVGLALAGLLAGGLLLWGSSWFSTTATVGAAPPGAPPPVATSPSVEPPAGPTVTSAPPAPAEPELAAAGPSDDAGAGDDAFEGVAMAFKLSDAGVVIDELSADTLAEADQALDDPVESEAEPEPATLPPASVAVRTLAQALSLASKGNLDGAIAGVRVLRRKNPQDPRLPATLGDLYFDKGWWTDGLSKYREATRMRSTMARRATMQKNAIRALGSNKTYARARTLLTKDMRRFVVPRLRRAAKSDPSKIVRSRAELILRNLRR